MAVAATVALNARERKRTGKQPKMSALQSLLFFLSNLLARSRQDDDDDYVYGPNQPRHFRHDSVEASGTENGFQKPIGSFSRTTSTLNSIAVHSDAVKIHQNRQEPPNPATLSDARSSSEMISANPDEELRCCRGF